MDTLNGRVAVVTGAGSGVGLGIAHALAAAGANVVVSDIDDVAAASVADAIVTGGGTAVACRTDVTKTDELEALAATAVSNFGAVHVLANNAGVMTQGPLADATEEDWSWVLGVNLRAVIAGVRVFLPLLREHAPGHIVNTVSMSAVAPRLGGGLGVYSVSKAALLSYTEILRAELEPENIGVSALLPGPVDTRIWEAERSRPVQFGERRDMSRPERADQGLDPREVGRMVVDGILGNQTYVFTNSGSRARVERRYERMTAALDSVEGPER